MSSKPPKELIKFLRPYDRSIRDLALSLRELVIAELAPCHENIYDAYNAVALGYGPTDRLKDGICHIAVYAGHVNLGFNKGATLPDPNNVLRGTGKQIRHITLKNSSDLSKPELRTYLSQARKQAGHSTSSQGKVVSVVKAIYPVKRRPNTR
jgi:hypothetical protein